MFTLLIILGLAAVVLGFGLFQRRPGAAPSAPGAAMPMIHSDVCASPAADGGAGSDPIGAGSGGGVDGAGGGGD